MKRIWMSAVFVACAGVALAQPPVDYTLYCGEGAEAPMIGVASVTEGHVHVALVDGATCDDVVVASPTADFTVVLGVDEEGEANATVAFDDPEATFEVTIAEVPQVAVDGMRRAHENRAAARERAAAARAQGETRSGDGTDDGEATEFESEGADEAGGPPAHAGPPAGLPNAGGRD